MSRSKPSEPAWPPFTHFPAMRGDMLAGEPVPSTPTAEAAAAMTMGRLQRRLKVLGMIMRMKRLGERFHEAARVEADVLVAELRRRLQFILAEATSKRGARRKVPQRKVLH